MASKSSPSILISILVLGSLALLSASIPVDGEEEMLDLEELGADLPAGAKAKIFPFFPFPFQSITALFQGPTPPAPPPPPPPPPAVIFINPPPPPTVIMSRPPPPPPPVISSSGSSGGAGTIPGGSSGMGSGIGSTVVSSSGLTSAAVTISG